MCVHLPVCVAYTLIAPCRGKAVTGNAHTGAFFAATSIVTLKIEESQFTSVAVFSLHVLLQERKAGREVDKKDTAKFIVCPRTDVMSTRHVIAVLMW